MQSEAAKPERRLAAIFAADVEGYSRLMSEDEAGTLATLTAYREIMDGLIAQHRGRIANTAGDSVLADFPSVVDAVECAATVQERLAEANARLPQGGQVRFRIGVHVGDVMVRGDDLLGDGVNVAARVQSLAEPGGVWLSEDAHRQVAGKIAQVFEDRGEQHVKNLPQPVRVYALIGAGRSGAERRALAVPEKPSIAVLPFANMSGDPEQEYFAEGIAEDIITELSRIKAFFVIARNSSFTYKGRSVDVRVVGRELGVRYVLEGSVRRSADRVRVTGQLIEAESGNHLWADRFDAKLENIFELQDQITRSVVATIEPEIYLSERNKGLTRPPGDLKAWDYLLRAMPHFWRWSDADTLEALRLLGKSIECDRHYALALGVSAYVQWVRGYMGWGEAAELFPSAREAARRAISEDEGEAWGHLALGFIHCVFREHEAALFECQQAIRLNPNYPYAHTAYGFALTCGGKADPALEAVRLARRLNPRDPLIAIPTSVEGMAHMVAGDYELSARLQEQAIQQRPEMVSARRSLISVLGHLGRLEEAKVHLAEVLRHTPSFSLSWVERYHPLVRQEDRGRYIEGLRKAGVPE